TAGPRTRTSSRSCYRNVACAPKLGALPPPLWGRVGEGGRSLSRRSVNTSRPPPLTPPHKGEGNSLSMTRAAVEFAAPHCIRRELAPASLPNKNQPEEHP